MAKSSRRRSDRSSFRSSLWANGPHFFKLIHPAIPRDRKLIIPTKFVKKHGKGLSNRAILKVSNGAVWEVEMISSNGKVWLHNDGWEKFKEYYSICYGHFLVFRYDGNSEFHVFIFDKSASEIEYPSSVGHGEQTEPNCELLVPKRECLDVEDSVEILDNFPTCQTGERIACKELIKKEPSTKNNFPARKGKNTSISKSRCNFQSRGTLSNIVKPEKSDKNLDSRCSQQEIKKECSRGMPCANEHLKSEVRKSLAADEKLIAFQRANNFKSDNPFFMVLMHPSYVCYPCILNIPLSFAREHLARNQDIILEVSNGTTWSVKGTFGKRNAKLYSAGWKSFVKENNLSVGDVCVFELIKGTLPMLKVFIFRPGEDSKKF